MGGKVVPVPDDSATERHLTNMVLRRFAPYVRNRSLWQRRVPRGEASADASAPCSPGWSVYSVAQTTFCAIVLLPIRLLCLGVMLVLVYVSATCKAPCSSACRCMMQIACA